MNSNTYKGIRISERGKAIFLLIITAVLWSLGGILIKSINWNPLAIAGTRSLIAASLMLIILKKPKIDFSKAQIGAMGTYAATVILFVVANKMTTAANAILLQYTAPIYVAIFGSFFLKEKATKLDLITILIVLGGMVLFFCDHLNASGFLGNILAAASGLSFGLFAVFMRMQKNGSPLVSVFLGNILTAIIGIPFMLGSIPSSSNWLNLALLGVVQLGIPYILYSKAIKHVSALDAILVPIIEPILNPIWVFLVVGEAPGRWAIIGGMVVIAAVTFRCILPVIRTNGS